MVEYSDMAKKTPKITREARPNWRISVDELAASRMDDKSVWIYGCGSGCSFPINSDTIAVLEAVLVELKAELQAR